MNQKLLPFQQNKGLTSEALLRLADENIASIDKQLLTQAQ